MSADSACVLAVSSTALLGMVVGTRYVVTKASKNGEFQVGDHIELCEDGDVLNREAHGWMPAEDLAEATQGMELGIDVTWAASQRAKLERQLASLPNAMLSGKTAAHDAAEKDE